MDPIRIAIRCILSFAFLLALLRLSGKRVVQEATTFDLVVALIMGDLIDNAIYAEVPYTSFIIAATTIFLMEIIITLFVSKSDKCLWWMEGRPGLLLENGHLNRDVMWQEKLNDLDSASLLRLQGFEQEKWHQLKLVTIEAAGKPAVLKQKRAQPGKKKNAWLLRKKT